MAALNCVVEILLVPSLLPDRCDKHHRPSEAIDVQKAVSCEPCAYTRAEKVLSPPPDEEAADPGHDDDDNNDDGDGTYPEGGLEAWLVVLGIWFAMLAPMGLMNSVGIFQAYTLAHQLAGHSEGTVGWIFSVYNFLAFFCGVYVGPVFDKYGPRWLVVAGCASTVSGVVSLSFCKELWHFVLSFGVLAGVGTSLLFTPSIAAIGHWFRRRRGLATGLACTAGGIGGIAFPLMLAPLFDSVGFAWATRALALVCLACSLVGVILVRGRLPPARGASAHPDLRILAQPAFALTTAAVFLLEFSLFIPLTYVSAYALRQGFPQDFALHLLPIMNAGSVVGRALSGYYADVIGPFNTCLTAVLMSLIACLCLWLPLGHTTPGLVLFSVLFGFSSDTSIAVTPVCIGRMCKTHSYGRMCKTHSYGRYYATAYTVVSLACLLGVPVGGTMVHAAAGSYTALIVLTGAVYIASAICMLRAKTWQLGRRNWLAVY